MISGGHGHRLTAKVVPDREYAATNIPRAQYKTINATKQRVTAWFESEIEQSSWPSDVSDSLVPQRNTRVLQTSQFRLLEENYFDSLGIYN